MFFWKKKEKKDPTCENTNAPSEQEKSTIKSEIESLRASLEMATGEERISCLNRIGALYKTCGEPLESIRYYEKSMEETKNSWHFTIRCEKKPQNKVRMKKSNITCTSWMISWLQTRVLCVLV